MDMSELLKKKKKGPEMDSKNKDAKMGVLKDIRDMAANDMGDEVRGFKKVSVMAPDERGLEEGLDKAKELVDGEGKGDKGENPDMFHEHPPAKSDDYLDKIEDDLEGCSPDELDKAIAMLQAKKAEMSSKSE